jgi:glucosamine--fructose-6-phosphate aminotransferase (isomerizing)
MFTSPLLRQIKSLPALFAEIVPSQWVQARSIAEQLSRKQLSRIYVAGCGDSHHAAVGSALAFQQFTGLQCTAETAMQFSRYTAPFLSAQKNGNSLVLAISASGEVSRSIEVLEQAARYGATTLALTGNSESTLGSAADYCFTTSIPSLSGESAKTVVPGTRSYFASMISLYLLSVAIGTANEYLTAKAAVELVNALIDIGESIERIIEDNIAVTEAAAERWREHNSYVFCGAGPNFGAAMFSAAKLIEACGDRAQGQDLEEWAHLQYFEKEVDTPTIIIQGGSRDRDRAFEVAAAARAIGRQLGIICPGDELLLNQLREGEIHWKTARVRECFSPLVACIPALLLASERASLLNEPYFRDFSGGRSKEGGGGISKIRSSKRLD